MAEIKSPPKPIEIPFLQMIPFPMVYLPGLTQLTKGYQSLGQRGTCAGFELDYQRCLARVGMKSYKLCTKENEDFSECIHHTKQRTRYKIMREERERQKKAPLPPPAYDSIGHNFPS